MVRDLLTMLKQNDINYLLKGKSMTFRLIEITLPKYKQQASEALLSDRKEVLDLQFSLRWVSGRF